MKFATIDDCEKIETTMFFNNHRSNTEAGYSVSAEWTRDGLLRINVTKELDDEFDWIDFSDGVDGIGLSAVNQAINWAMSKNYIVKL